NPTIQTLYGSVFDRPCRHSRKVGCGARVECSRRQPPRADPSSMLPRHYDASAGLWREAGRCIPGASQTISKRVDPALVGRYPAVLEHGQGARVWDVDGNEYIDFLHGLGPVILGYAHPAVDEAIRAALAQGIVYGLPHRLEIEAARAVVEAVPCAEMV